MLEKNLSKKKNNITNVIEFSFRYSGAVEGKGDSAE